MKKEKKALFLPAELYDRIEERVKATEFNSISEYVIFVMEEVLKEEEEDEGEKALSKEDEKDVRDRLRSLGYVDQ